MMDGLFDFFQPAQIQVAKSDDGIRRLADSALVHTEDSLPTLDEAQIVIVGVNESRGHHANKGCAGGADRIRHYLYRLNDIDSPLSITDMGNIEPGERIDDTYAALRVVIGELLRAGKIPVVI
jgi:arginase family enzyme